VYSIVAECICYTVTSYCMCVWIFIAGATFAYDGQKPLFVDLDFGIDMASRS